jgi:hypothetical protein
VQISERVDDLFAHRPAQVGPALELGRFVGANDAAAPAFHHVERRAGDARVVAQQIRTWSKREDRVQRCEPAALTRHVVRARGNGPERRTAQHEIEVAEADQIREIRVSAGKLLDGYRRARVEAGDAIGQFLAKIRAESIPIELFARAHRGRVTGAHCDWDCSRT